MRRRSLAPLAIALATLLPTLAAEAGPRQAAPPRLTFSRPLQVEAHDLPSAVVGNGERQSSGEPSIKVDSKGVIYLSGVTTVGRASPVWISQNGGKSFEILHTPAQFRELSPLGAEGDIAIGDDDRMYFVDTGVSFLAFSRWAPASGHGDQPAWEYTYPHTLGVLPGLDDRPWLAYASDGATEVLWLYVNHGSHVSVYRSTDGGRRWSETFNTVPAQRYFPGMIAVPRHSTTDAFLFGDCQRPEDQPRAVCSAHTHDGGSTWEEIEVARIEEGRAVAPFMVANAVDRSGVVYATWAEADVDDADEDAPNPNELDADDGCDVYYASSRDGGHRWTRKVRVGDGKGCAVFPWITAGDHGRAAIAWYETDANGPNADDLHPATSEVGAAEPWYLHAAVILERSPTRRQIVAAVADPTPVHLGPLFRELWDFLQIAVGPDGRFHIAYAEDVSAGANGPLGIGVPDQATVLGAQVPKDTMYVQQRGGPRLYVEPHGDPPCAFRPSGCRGVR